MSAPAGGTLLAAARKSAANRQDFSASRPEVDGSCHIFSSSSNSAQIDSAIDFSLDSEMILDAAVSRLAKVDGLPMSLDCSETA